jgi:hypothetical protein
MYNCQGLSTIVKLDFFYMFWPSWETAFSKKNIDSGWKNTDLHPWNPEIVLTHFTREKDKRPSSSESSGLSLRQKIGEGLRDS